MLTIPLNPSRAKSRDNPCINVALLREGALKISSGIIGNVFFKEKEGAPYFSPGGH